MAKNKEPGDDGEKRGSGKHRASSPLPQRKDSGAKAPKTDPYRPIETGPGKAVTCFGCGKSRCECTRRK